MNLKISFSRIYSFSAAHRLHSPLLSDEQNVDVYEKCNNPSGHGHDYFLEVSLIGVPDENTGMIFSLPEMDRKINEFLLRLEHKHQDYEVPYFKEHISTGENIVRYLWNELSGLFPPDMLYHIKLWETNNNYFECGVDV